MKSFFIKHYLQVSHFKFFEQLKLRRETNTKGDISFDQTHLENEKKIKRKI